VNSEQNPEVSNAGYAGTVAQQAMRKEQKPTPKSKNV